MKNRIFFVIVLLLLQNFICIDELYGRTGEKYSAFSGMSKEKAIEVQKAAAEHYKLPMTQRITINEGTFIELVLLPPGEFMMGSKYSKEKSAELFGRRAKDYDLEHPRHPVRITKPFYMGKYEITQLQWNAIMETNPSKVKGDLLPVQNITWNACKEFCKKVSAKSGKEIRLPTEAEWEYGCRAGTTSCFYFGESITKKQVNFDSEQSVVVGSFPANAWGLYNMHGNVSEWVNDNYGFYPAELQIDPTGAAATDWSSINGHMIRGGGYDRSKLRMCRSAFRYAHPKFVGDQNCGFRIVYSVK